MGTALPSLRSDARGNRRYFSAGTGAGAGETVNDRSSSHFSAAGFSPVFAPAGGVSPRRASGSAADPRTTARADHRRDRFIGRDSLVKKGSKDGWRFTSRVSRRAARIGGREGLGEAVPPRGRP